MYGPMYMEPTSPSGSVSTLSGLGVRVRGWEGTVDVSSDANFEVIWRNDSTSEYSRLTSQYSPLAQSHP
jgi:hypothetical protein